MKYFINLKNVKKNGKVTIYILCHLCGKTVPINTRVETYPDKFNSVDGRIKGTSKEVKDSNLILKNCEARITEVYTKYRLLNRLLTPDLLKKEYENPSLYIDFYKYLEKEIKERYENKELAFGTYKHHLSLLNKLRVFKSSLAFSEITPELIKEYERFYKRKPHNNKKNTIHSDFKRWRAYLEIAVKREIITKNPFTYISLSTEKTQRRYLEEKELLFLINIYKKGYYFNEENKKTVKINLTDSENKTLRHFLFMCLTGLRISDFKSIAPEQVRDNKLYYIPIKTKGNKTEEICIHLSGLALKLIADETHNGAYLFNTYSEQVMNRFIKELLEKLEINKAITNHSARHTFATLFVEKTNDVASLQKILGHARIEQTMVYVHISREKVLKQMQNFEKLLTW